MRSIIQKFAVAAITLLMIQLPAMADNDRPVKVHELPQQAQQLIKKVFHNLKVTSAEMDKDEKTYEVKFSNGTSVEFDKAGRWTEIDCEKRAVPTRLVPQPVLKHVKKNWPNAKIVKMEKDRKKFEIELSNDVEVTYNKDFKVLEVEK